MTEHGTGAEASVYARIRAMILDGRMPPGERITIDRMARELGVSQTPVREAMQRLEGDKLVQTRQPRGYATTPLLSTHDLKMMFEVRLLLEPWAARAAAVDRAANPGRALLAEIDDFVTSAEGAAAAGCPVPAASANGGDSADGGDSAAADSPAQSDGEDWKQALSQHDTRFHLLLLDATGNRFLLDAYRQMHPHLHLFRLYPGDPHGTDTAHEHAQIAQAIAACDPTAAETAMRSHLLHSLSRFSASASGEIDLGEGGSADVVGGGAGTVSTDGRDIAAVRSTVLGLKGNPAGRG